jgi:hypothetical protein
LRLAILENSDSLRKPYLPNQTHLRTYHCTVDVDAVDAAGNSVADIAAAGTGLVENDAAGTTRKDDVVDDVAEEGAD